jgi:hypothetical protein
MKQPKKEERSQKPEDRSRFAIVGDPDDPKTWLLSHHSSPITHHSETTVDWNAMADSVAILAGIHGNRVAAPPEIVIEAAKHLVRHYEQAKKPIPDALAVLI